MIITLNTLPSAGGGAAFASVTPAGTLLMEQAPITEAVAGGAAITALDNDFPVTGDLLWTNTSAPPTPPAGQARMYVDSALKQLSLINDTGAIVNVGGNPTMAALPIDAVTSALEFVIDGGGLPLTLNQLSPYLIVPTACVVTGVTLLADQSGSVTIDVWMCTYANFAPGTHPVVGDSITASAVPAIATTFKYQDNTLTGWTTSVPAGNVMACNVKVAATSITRVTCAVLIKKI